MGDSGGSAGAGGSGTGGVQFPMEDVLGALALFMEQHRANQGGQGATKALKAVVSQTGRFSGKNISNFLRTYICEMEVHQVDENQMMQTFNMAVVPEIRDRVQEIRNLTTSWATFAERLRDEYFDEDSERMTKRSFLEWVEQRPGNTMGPHELLKDFEKKFGQLPMAERHLLESRKAELFLQATDAALEDRLLLLLGDRTTESGFTNDWRRVEETVILLAKQHRVRSRGGEAREDAELIQTPKTPKVSFAPTPLTNLETTSKATKTVEGNALEELIKGFRELRVEFTELKKARGASSSQPSEGTRKFARRCVWCDEETEHSLRACASYEEALKNVFVFYKDGKIHDASTGSPLGTNYGRGGMKKLMEEKMTKSSYIQAHESNAFHIQVEQHSNITLSAEKQVLMRRGAQAIRKATGWEDPVDANSIRAFMTEEHDRDELYDASVEEKRVRFDTEDGEEPASKRRSPVQNDPAKEMRKRVPTRSRAADPSPTQPHDMPLPKEWWEKKKENDGSTEQPNDSKRGLEKGESSKAKGKTPAYKLQSDIENSIDMKGILEERILDAKIEFTLREALGIAKKDFHELIIDVIKRKRQMTAETVMVRALDTHMTEDEEIEIGEVFAMMGEPVVQKEEIPKTEAQSFQCSYSLPNMRENEERVEFDLPFWARAATETKIKLGELNDHVLALIDHGSEINIMSRGAYDKGKWPIDTDHGWVMRAANSGRTRLHGACPAVPTKIGDVEVEQNFFVQNLSTYPIILGQPFITASRMETKVLDDGSHYARIRSIDGRKSVQFLTVKPDNERHRLQLREIPLPTSLNFPDF
jgi:Protein of unknown function (DUF4100)